ncbi:AbrB/MazE/SpoVT family DNA-binding domain-containing protein [Dactylosporangium vinaceum]|uniref:AbrB/MazE/SpoVT family DNA-binding domain-containing protein n=1 Tax=Dactylosporangium vinaceum TaxID=53362 RepID=A0ABV5MJE4_9ACTN|nr:AbrB/MazE/SpoVT family DNA-binding domain-containing protein [Dactylosporangium vinaceum]UAB93826.1 AbrB/MazE/SpoVT family DNA-binding domain-containing protein [Dactylosporangium vinaceum]
MTSIVPALIPASPGPAADSQTIPGRTSRGPLPLATFADERTRSTLYALPAIDINGRLADQTIVRSMGWEPGTRYAIKEHGGLLLVEGTAHGIFSITRRGHLYIPAVVRRRFAIAASDRLFVAADPAERRIVIHPPAAVDAMITERHRLVLGGAAG